jgi:hypothetical protein
VTAGWERWAPRSIPKPTSSSVGEITYGKTILLITTLLSWKQQRSIHTPTPIPQFHSANFTFVVLASLAQRSRDLVSYPYTYPSEEETWLATLILITVK